MAPAVAPTPTPTKAPPASRHAHQQQQQPPVRPEVLYCLCFLYSLAFMAQAPLLPYLVAHIGLDAGAYATLQSLFSALQLVGGLLSGPLVDRHGGRALLLLSFAASAVSYSLTAAAGSIRMLLLSRVATLAQHAVLAARTLVAHGCVAGGERAVLLGRIGAAYGLGFALGPAAGGLLSSIVSLQATAWAAAASSLLALGIAAVCLPPDTPQQRGGSSPSTDTPASKPEEQQRASLASLAAVVQHRGVPALLLMQAGSNLAGSMLHTTFALVLREQYGLSSRGNGLVMSSVGACIVVGQTLVVRPASAAMGEAAAVKAGAGALILTFLALGAARQLWQLLACLLPLGVASVVVSTLNTSRLSKAAPSSQAGSALALDMSLASGLRTVAPLAATAIMQRSGRGFPAVCATAAAVLTASYAAASFLPAPPQQQQQHTTAAAGEDAKKRL